VNAPINHSTIPPIWWCYLIHFDHRYYHAGHYCGMSGCLDARLKLHRAGNGARLMEVIGDAHIEWEVARLWPCASYEEARALERRLKQRHEGPRLCPLCQHRPLDPYTSLRQGHWPIALHEKQGKHQPMGASKPPLFVRIERQVAR
jgi:predicted GIY-YIG superfamily endonuclease